MLAVVAVIVLIPAAGLLVVGLRRAPVALVLGAYAAVVPFGSSFAVPLGVPPPFNTLSSLLGFVAVGWAVAHIAVTRTSAGVLLRAVPAWLFFVAVCAVTLLWSVDPAGTMDEIVLLVSIFLLYLVSTLLPVDRRDYRWIGTGTVIGAALASAFGIGLLLSGRAPVGLSGAARFGFAGGDDPNITAAAFLLPLMVACGRTIEAETRGPRMAWAGAAMIIAAGVVLTGSRGGIAAAVVGLVVLSAHGESRWRTRALVGAVVVAGLSFTLAPQGLRDRLASTDSTGRTDIWQLGIGACDEHCLLGSGWGTFGDVYADAFRSAPEAGGFRNEDFKAHNIWLQCLIELGFVGFVLALAGFALAAVDLLGLPRAVRGPPLAALAALAASNSLVSNMAFKYFWLVFMYAAFATISHAAAPAPVAGPGRDTAVRGHR